MSNWPIDGVKGIGSWEARNNHLFRDIPDELIVYEGPRRRAAYVEGTKYTERDLTILEFIRKNEKVTPKQINNGPGNGAKEWCRYTLTKLLNNGKIKREKGIYSLAD